MKKITLFLVAMFAMVNIANAQRAWAYDLGLTSGSESYTFSFKAVTAADATLVFYKDGVETGTLDLGSVGAGQNTVTKTSADLLEVTKSGGDFTWGVKMTGSAINAVTEVTDQSRGIYDFYNMMGVTVDNDPESKNFSKIYIQQSYNGASDGATTRADNQKAGVFIYDQELNELNSPSNIGIQPTLPTGYTMGDNRNKFHRLNINPITGDLVYSYNISGSPAVFAIDRENMTGEVKNLLAGITGLTQTCAHCFDADGNLYVMDLASSKGTVYKIKDGVKTQLTTATGKFVNASMSMASDGRGGLWVGQNRGQLDAYYQLAHITSNGAIDWSVYSGTTSTHNMTGSSARGAMAYDAKHQILAQGRNGKVELYNVTYDATTGLPTVTAFKTVSSTHLGANIDGLAFDYAGDLYVVNSSKEKFQKFAVPTNNNTCTTPAPKAQTITLVAATPEHTVTINKNGEGTVTGANTGTYLQGSELTLTATPAEHYTFTGWTGDVTSTDNPLTVTVDGDKTITANFVKNQYTLTVNANDDTKGAVNPTLGTYEAETEVEITATANTGYEFIGWSNGSKANPLTISVTENINLTANFRAVLPDDITLNAHPAKDYSTSIVGTMKRAIQNGENTIVLTHEADGTPHIYNIAHATKAVTEISQKGVVAATDGFLSISDIALTEDGKLVACNYVHCTYAASNTSYFYIWDNIADAPHEWFTSQKSGNYNDAYMGYTMALKGTSQNAEVTISAFNKSNTNTRYSHIYVVDGKYSDANYKYSRDNAALHPNTLGPNSYELNASPLAAGKWIVDGELSSPIEFVEKDGVAIDTYTALSLDVLGKKYNGASYLFHNDHHLMVAPYADGSGKLAGVKVLGISDGFAAATQITTSTDLANAIDATAAAATAYVDGDGDLTIYLFADSKVYTFSEKAYTAQTFTVTATAGEGGSVEGGGAYEEGATATLTATPNEHYTFTNWTFADASTSNENPLTITVNSDVEVTANFTEDPKSTITVTSDDENMGTVSGSGTYYEGETVTLSAISKGGYTFVKWNDEETTATRTITVGEDDATYTAYFKQATPRAWAYDLRKVENGENYDFTFKTTSAGTATLIFKNKDGNILDFGIHTSAATTAEEKTITIAKTTFDAATQDIYWEVQMDGDPIENMAELTDPTKGIYSFYLPQGVAVDNNPESSTFSKIYVAESTDGASDGGSVRADTQKRGIFIYDQTLAELNPTSNVGIIPSNVTLTNTSRNALKRIAINPKTKEVAFAYNASPAAVWAVSSDDVAGEATNLLEGLGFEYCNSLCFDENGILYIFDNGAGYPAKGSLYKIVNGEKHTIFFENSKYGNADNSLASDGRGGLWIAQNRSKLDGFNQLAHVSASGVIDFEVNSTTTQGFASLETSRGAMAYNPRENILAIGCGASGAIGVSLYQVTYDPLTSVPSLEYIGATPSLGKNVEGIAFDYAGDLYALSAHTERLYKFVVPTNDNTCTVPAPKSEAIKLETRYTVTVVANDNAMGTVSGGGTEFLYDDKVTVTAVANANYEFVNWTENGTEVSPDAEYTFNIKENRNLVANFQVEPLKIKGIVKRAVQVGESTVVLTHEADGTPHLYTIVDGTLTSEISQDGVIARDPENAGDLLAISDIAATEDGKLIAINKIVCQSDANQVATGYKRGETRIYIWNDLTSNPTIWFTSAQSSNWYKSVQGHTMAIKGTSSNAIVFVTGMNLTNGKSRYSIYTVKEGVYNGDANNNNEYYHFTKKDAITPSTLGENYELNASPLSAENWILDGGLVDPFEITDPLAYNTEVTVGATINDDLGKKFNGATYLTVEGIHLMVAPYADGEDVGGVTVLNISGGLDKATELNYYEFTTPVAATAAATAVKVNGDTLYVTLITDSTIHYFTISVDLPIYTRTVTNGRYGTICLPYGSNNMTGATFYDVAWMNVNVSPYQVYVDEVTELEAGKPYIFLATDTQIKVIYQGDEATAPSNYNGLYGTFEAINDGAEGSAGNILEDNYILSNNAIIKCRGNCKLSTNRAYFKLDEITRIEPSLAPGRRRVALGVQGGNQTTGVDNLTEDGTIDPNVEGTYDVLGRQITEPVGTGFYIVNGKKQIIVK